jgi:hypothetical protein
MTTVLLLAHSLLAVALLGAVTHQAFASSARRAEARKASFMARFRTTDAAAYRNAIVVLYICVSVLGAVLYPNYRNIVRPALQSLDLRGANGAFEIKEHFSAIGLIVLPAYWVCWAQPLQTGYAVARVWLTWILASIVWWNFVVGQLLVAIKGLFS